MSAILDSKILSITRGLIRLEKKLGDRGIKIDLEDTIEDICRKYGLVDSDDVEDFVETILGAYDYVKRKKIKKVNNKAYFKFKIDQIERIENILNDVDDEIASLAY